jgi:hypothetical protein
MHPIILRPLQYLLSTPNEHKHLYSENYISLSDRVGETASSEKVDGKNIGEWVTKAYKASPSYLCKLQSFDETWAEVTTASLIREITTLTLDQQKLFCAPKISLCHSYFGGQIFTLSMALEGFVNLTSVSDTEEDRYHFLRKMDNFPEIIAACFLTGQFDLHEGNLGFIQHHDKYYMAKVDHGQAFDQCTALEDPYLFLSTSMRDYAEYGLPSALFFSTQFAEGLELITQKANDHLIIASLVQGFNQLYRNGAVPLGEASEETNIDSLIEKLQLNKYNLLNLAKLIRLHGSIKEGNLSLFAELLTSQWYFFKQITELRFCDKLGFYSDLHPSELSIRELIEKLASVEIKAEMLMKYEEIVALTEDKLNRVEIPPLSTEDQQFLEKEKEQLNQVRQTAFQYKNRLFQAATTSLIFGAALLASAVYEVSPIITQVLGITASYLWSVKNQSNFGTYLMAAGAALQYAGWPTLSWTIMSTSTALLMSHVLSYVFKQLIYYNFNNEGVLASSFMDHVNKIFWLEDKVSKYSVAVNYLCNKVKVA